MIPIVDLWDFETTEEVYTTPNPLTTEPVLTESGNYLLEAADASCNIGYYSPSGFATCIQCEKGTYSSAYQQQTSCNLCTPGKFAALDGMGQCSSCPAGTFSYSNGSSMCSSCPPWTGSFSSMSSCVTCSNSSGLCLYADQTSCPVCGSVCVLCNAGYYNEGNGGSCVACSAGTYNDMRGAMRQSQCNTCGSGTYAKKSSSGLTACLSCSLVSGYPAPDYATYIEPSGGFSEFMCKWKCNIGYASGVALPSETSVQWVNSYSAFIALPNSFSDTEAREMIRLKYSYCCNIQFVIKGTYLKGCTKISIGEITACPAIPNAHHIEAEAQIDKCAFWVCDDGFYLFGGQCVAQPVCGNGFTYRRKSDGSMDSDLDGIPSPGKFVCVICPVCANGTETAVPCNSTYSAVCRMCGGGRQYSVNGNACLENVPYGYRAVKESRTISYIPWGERPLWLSDNTPVSQGNSQVFFSYIQCPDAGYGRSFIGGDEVCSLTSMQGCTQCLSQCSKWKSDGKGWFSGIGFYGADSQACNVCVFDGTKCSGNSIVQFLNMSTCGPNQMPQCANCPAIDNPHQEGWVTPTDSIFNGKYPCVVRCETGFSAYNDVCIECPNIPLNIQLTRGCEWECKEGFLKSADGVSCVACPVPSVCDTGYYRGYNGTVNVCLSCMGCVKLPNSAFTTSGAIDRDRTSCSYRCDAGFYDAGGCKQCAVKTCVDGGSYLKQCTATENTACVTCKKCSISERAARVCTVSNDTVCVPCESGLLPQNAAWSAMGCVSWSCKQGFWLDDSVCRPCSVVSECALGFQLVDIYQCVSGNPYTAARGRCDACTPPPAGKCFSGGSSCGLMQCVVLATPSTMITPVLSTSTARSTIVTTVTPVLVITTTKSSDFIGTSATPMLTTTKSSDFIGTSATPMLTTTRSLIIDTSSTVKSYATTSVLKFNTTSAKNSTNTTSAKNSTSTSTPTTTPAALEPVAFATIASLTINETEITAMILDSLVNNVAEVVCTADIILCNISVLSVTVNNVTTFCKDSVCPGYQRRRALLAVKKTLSVSVGILTSRMLSDFSSDVRSIPSVETVTVYPNAPLTNAQLDSMKDSRVMSELVLSKSTVFYAIIPSDSSSSGLVVIAVFIGVFVFLIALMVACCCCCCYFSQTPVKKKLVPTTVIPSGVQLIIPSSLAPPPLPYNPNVPVYPTYPPPPFYQPPPPTALGAKFPSIITNIRITTDDV